MDTKGVERTDWSWEDYDFRPETTRNNICELSAPVHRSEWRSWAEVAAQACGNCSSDALPSFLKGCGFAGRFLEQLHTCYVRLLRLAERGDPRIASQMYVPSVVKGGDASVTERPRSGGVWN